LPPPPYIWEITRLVCAEADSDARQEKPSKLRKIERSEFGLNEASEQ
jgi:hypothetical protein